jgi:transcriptional regulator with XRE-family HTH domain
MQIKKKLGSRIRELRINQSLTQEALAEKVNLSAKSLSQIELGNNFVSAETLGDLCAALDVSPKVLFDFQYCENIEENPIDFIIKRLKRNPALLKIIYKIVMALDS